MKYDEISSKFGKNDMIESLNDGVVKKYSGYLTLVGLEDNATGYDSLNKELVVFEGGKIAKVIEKGIDHEGIAWDKHVANVRRTCKRLECTPSQLLNKNYTKELRL